MPTSQSKRTQYTIKQIYPSPENKMKFGGASFFGRDANEPLSAHSSVRTSLDNTKQENTMYYRHQISISVLWKQDELCRCLLSLEKMHWHNEAVGSPHSRSKDVNAKIPTSKSQTTRYGVVYEIERSNTKYQDVQVYAMKSIRRLCVLSVLEHNHSMYVDHQNGELTSTSAHHNAQNDQEKLLALRCACHHTAKTYKHNYKHVLCHYRAYTTPTHFTRIDRKATSLITHLLDSSPDTRASSSASRNLPFVLAAFLENDRDSRAL